jgi:serine/threonine protein kinase
MHVNFKFIHRDIKPENVLINAPNMPPNVVKKKVWEEKDFINQVEIKLCDLGLSKPLEIQGTAT